MKNDLESLPNIGSVLKNNLFAVGIDTPEMLRKAGAKEAFLLNA